MNGHPRARMKLILRQYETEVKIFNSRWFPASNYRFKWSNIASQGSNMKKTSKKSIFQIFFWIFLSIQGVQGAIREGPEPIPELKKHQKNANFQNYKNCKFRPKIIIIIFRRATIIITIMAAGLQKDEFWLYIGRLRHGPNSITYR